MEEETIARVRKAFPFIVHFINEMFFEEEDDEGIDHQQTLEKVDNYAEEIVPRMTDLQFKSHFRLDPDTFEALMNKIYYVNLEQAPVKKGRPETNLEKQLMVALWCLANQEPFRSVADRFGIAPSTAWESLHRMCSLLMAVNVAHGIIKWPTRDRALTIIRQHQRKSNFPGVIGAIDGSHIPITAPSENPVSYVNRKSFHSVLLQGVCDHEFLFTDCYAGEAGSIHDACLYRRSDLCDNITNNINVFPEDSHMIGDGAYTLSDKILVPFKNNGYLTDRQKNFNLTFSSSRATIEQAFALLKGRFRRLKRLDTTRMDLVCLLIMSACILHNICILGGDDTPVDTDVEDERRQERELNAEAEPDVNAPNIARLNITGQQKRNRIANLLPMRLHLV